MVSWGLFLGELLVLFITSQRIFSAIFLFIYRIFHSKRIAMYFLSLIFFPGVVVHELSHFLMAELLRVRVHDMVLVPKFEGDGIKMGSVQMERSDPFRRFFIGIAPLLVGSIVLVASVSFLLQGISFSNILSDWGAIIRVVLLGYVSFVIANTMFSSKKDMEGALELLILASILSGGVYLVIGKETVLQGLSWLGQGRIMSGVELMSKLLVIPVIINLIFSLVFVFRKR